MMNKKDVKNELRAWGTGLAAAGAAYALYSSVVPLMSSTQSGGEEKSAEIDKHLFPAYMKNVQGLWLYVHRWEIKSPLGLVFICHGLGEHILRYEHVAQQLNAAGFSVYGMDHQGHGQSDGDRLFVENFSDFVNDYEQFVTEELDRLQNLSDASNRLRHLPRFIIGHSMGGCITIHLVATKRSLRWTGMILSSPALKIPDAAMPNAITVKMLTVAKNLFPKMIIHQADLASQVSRLDYVVRRYRADPLVAKHGPTARLAFELIEHMEKAHKLAAGKTWPHFFVMQAEDDTICDPQGARDFFHKARCKKKKMQEFPSYHELFNCVGSKQTIDEMLSWLTVCVSDSLTKADAKS